MESLLAPALINSRLASLAGYKYWKAMGLYCELFAESEFCYLFLYLSLQIVSIYLCYDILRFIWFGKALSHPIGKSIKSITPVRSSQQKKNPDSSKIHLRNIHFFLEQTLKLSKNCD